MKKIVLLVVAGLALATAGAAAAHPLGNFTINRFSRIEISGSRVYVLYVLDMAEIPTFQAGKIDARAYAARIAAGARLSVGGVPVHLHPIATALAHPVGAGGLRTTRLEVSLRGPRLAHPVRIQYRDTNYAGRIGWKEIVVGARSPSTSNELRAYPKNLLQSPLTITAVSARLVPGSGPEIAPTLTRGAALRAPDRVADAPFARLIAGDRLGIWVVLGSLAAAIFWGAAHALSPGHGKTIVTAYLVGQRGTPRHAALLGLIVTTTHTIGVFALGIVTLLLSRFIVPDHLYPWLNLTTGLLVMGIGASVLASRVHHRREHTHAQHHHDDDPKITGRSLLAVGVSGGLLPCPSALVVLLAAISLHRIAFGLLLIVAFSAGLASSITGIGLIAVVAKRAFRRLRLDGGIVGALPAASALVIVVAGIVMTLHALPKVA
jgi:nickel/cobalt transporter (NicO) family protein